MKPEDIETAIFALSAAAVVGMLGLLAWRLGLFLWHAYRPWTAEETAEFEQWVADGCPGGVDEWIRRSRAAGRRSIPPTTSGLDET